MSENANETLMDEDDVSSEHHVGVSPVVNNGEVPDVNHNEVDTFSSTSDSEDEEGAPGGYTLLPQGLDEDLTSDWLAAACTDDTISPQDETSANVTTQKFAREEEGEDKEEKEEQEEEEVLSDEVEAKEATNAATAKPEAEIKLKDTQVEAIKQAMAGFSLPSSSVPPWAKVVPEEVWKTELMEGLQRTTADRGGGQEKGKERRRRKGGKEEEEEEGRVVSRKRTDSAERGGSQH